MGIESVFIKCISISSHLEIKKSEGFDEQYFLGETQKSADDFISFLKLHGYKIKKIANNKYVVNKYFRLEIFSDEDYFQGFYLEGCLSNFIVTKKTLFQFVKCIDSDFLKLQIINAKSSLELVSEKSLTIIENEFSKKYSAFIKDFPYEFDSLSGECFYRKYKIHSFFSKLFKNR